MDGGAPDCVASKVSWYELHGGCQIVMGLVALLSGVVCTAGNAIQQASPPQSALKAIYTTQRLSPPTSLLHVQLCHKIKRQTHIPLNREPTELALKSRTVHHHQSGDKTANEKDSSAVTSPSTALPQRAE